MSRDQIAEHAGYLGDAVKLKAYRAALAELVEPGMSVLDLGSGTGILGILAAEAGARVVYAVDNGGILGPAGDIARSNGYGDRIIGIRDFSTRVTLPEQVDLAVCDQIGGLAYDAGVLQFFRDARERLLSPGGTMVPGGFRLFLAPIETESWRHDVNVWDSRPAGFDFSAMGEHAANTEFRLELDPSAFLAEPVQIADLAADDDEPITGIVEARIERAGELHGVAGMFLAQLSPSVTLTNCPLWPSSFRRWQTFYPLRDAVAVTPGDVVVTEFDLRPRSYIATWRVTVRPASGGPEIVSRRASTVLGWLVTPEDLAIERGGTVPVRTAAVDADRHALDLVDGTRPLGEIIELVWERHRDVFGTREDSKRRVTGLLARHLRKQATCGS